MMTCIIVEDELMARKSLEKLCAKTPSLELRGSFEGAATALDALTSLEVDLILLDIEMPGISGLEFLDRLPYMPQIIFTTSNKEYAFDAFEYEVTDFLKKPLTLQRFQKAIEKAIVKQEQLQNSARSSAKYEIYIRTDGRLVRLPFKNVLYFENDGDYIKAFTAQKSYLFHGTIKALDAWITYPRLLKIHRSYIVNLDKIVDIEENTLVIGKKVIPISRAYKSILIKSINIFSS